MVFRTERARFVERGGICIVRRIGRYPSAVIVVILTLSVGAVAADTDEETRETAAQAASETAESASAENPLYVDSISEMRNLSSDTLVHGRRVIVNSYHSGTGIGGGVFVWEAENQQPEDGGVVIGSGASGRFVRVMDARGTVRAEWFGARGDGDATLVDADYTSDVHIERQTEDALAINAAISYLRSIGGGTLKIGAGVFYTYGYLETLNFDISIEGAGIGVTVLRNTSESPVDAHGYGILRTAPQELSSITIRNLELDGNVYERGRPTAQFRSYPIAIYGHVNAVVSNIKAINSPIDSFFAKYINDPDCSLVVENSIFSDAFRNTASAVSGYNQSYVNCSFYYPGDGPFGGTRPRFTLDIEPDHADRPIRNIQFTSCGFYGERNAVVAGGVWFSGGFTDCEFVQLEEVSDSAAAEPWLSYFRDCQVVFEQCRFRGHPRHRIGQVRSEMKASSGSPFRHDQFNKFSHCVFDGAGLMAVNRETHVVDTLFRNSRFPVLFVSVHDTGRHAVHVENVTLINVFDGVNVGSGSYAAFAVQRNVEGPVYIDGLNVLVDEQAFVQHDMAASSYPRTLTGIFMDLGKSAEALVKNTHVQGYYRQVPRLLGRSANSDAMRDWRRPDAPPEDTAGNTTAGRGALYHNCTMQGDDG